MNLTINVFFHYNIALHGNVDVVNVLIDGFKDPEDLKDTCGSTPLMDAVRSGHVEIARRFVDAKVCSCECRDGMGRSSIHLAAQVHIIA